MTASLTLVNWNIGGAKYLELKSGDPANNNSREHFRMQLNRSLSGLIDQHNPDIITLQEIVHYEANGDVAHSQSILDDYTGLGFDYFPHILIDTERHSHQGKWNKVRVAGEWNSNSYLAQGNAFLVGRSVKHFPIFSLPKSRMTFSDWRAHGGVVTDLEERKSFIEDVILEAGIYFGSRDTEPRAASVLHLVIDNSNDEPQDVFVINAHLTTLTQEREGVPATDREASEKRLNQLSIIFDNIISRYNSWTRQGYQVRGDPERPASETTDRPPPVWIVAGDFNFTPDSEEYAYVRHRNFLDLIKDHGRGTKASGFGRNPTLTVDYVFAGPLFRPIDPHEFEASRNFNNIQIDKKVRVSDHFPIIVKVPLEF
jgi:endonuclease/exonuclease/phosphatase family metal-dependent hydrolase